MHTKERETVPVNKQYQEVNRLKVWNRRIESTQQTPRQGNQPVPRVVNLSRHTPPPTSEQLSTPFGL